MIKNFILYTLLVFVPLLAYNQTNQGYLEVKGSIKVERMNLSDAVVNIKQNGNLINTVKTDDKGKFTCQLQLNSVYELDVKKEGFFHKKILITTTVDEEEIAIFNYRFSMELLRYLEGFDASLFDEYMGKIQFDDEIGDFDYDLEYTQSMKNKIAAMMRDYERARKQAYKKIITDADKAFNEKRYDDAIALYDKAIDIDPYDPYPDDQIYMIDRIKKDDEKNQKNYDKNIEEADQYLAEQDYTNAKNYYNRALKYKDENYPKNQIVTIDQILAGQKADALADAEKQKQYRAAITAADKSFTAKNYEQSLTKYQEALGILPNEQYPKDKIAEVNGIIERLAQDKANQAAKDKAYAAAITLADGKFGQKSYEEAKAAYGKASEIKPQEKYPYDKIAEIDNLLAASKSKEEKYQRFIAMGDQAFTGKQYSNAKSNFEQALGIKPNEAYPQNKLKEIEQLLAQAATAEKQKLDAAYRQAIAEADAFFNDKNYQQAKDSYENALAVKPGESYPTQRITEIESILADLAAKRRAYDLHIANADNAYNGRKLSEARGDYQKALNIFPNEQYPKSRIQEIDQLLLAQKNKKEQLLAIEENYARAISQGDSLFALKEWELSRNSFEQAGNIKPDEKYPPNKIKEIDAILAEQRKLLAKYDGYIKEADMQFGSEQ